MTLTADDKENRVIVECEIEASPEKLWRALTDEELAADWLGAFPMTEEGPARQGPSFRVLEAEPYSRLRYAWHDPENPDAPRVVTIELAPLGEGKMHFRLTHGATARARQPEPANTDTPLALAA
ncbi:SRPBCC domain-containing protein [Chelativorans sp. M5D2P16]|uniref:SRPBCC family protein n=1 Tax=Chelativorans sp. M5D2P16 TaxID=3095678 RepID=UPI002AC9F260|nr:SRPBCC domain-containing protein [Chelativorans sp. M5D2P16]MDZ5697761.1 SRPBCC domain-containing protein [Chelativorans sp. M5D2P16]